MKFKEYIESHQVFTADDLRTVATWGTARTQLQRALKVGEVERVRRGVYVSKTGKYTGEAPDPFLVARIADPEAVVSYHSALVAHGVAHNVGFECAFRSTKIRSLFEYGGVRYVPFDTDDSPQIQSMHSKSYGAVRVTTREQTLVDCLMHPGRAGGVEETVRSCSAFPYLDVDALLEILEDASATTLSRVGWLLETKRENWNVNEDILSELEDHLGKGPYRLDPKAKETKDWSSYWRLCLPEAEEEILSWTS
ncbi:type IV toxin-antitoxin system AbiEi family antitoxin domain-containing protein [Lancefieldella rimae]